MSVRCLVGLHRWEHFAVKTNLGSGNVVRICARCKDLQNWMTISCRWSMTFDPDDSIAQEILRRAEVTRPYAPVDYTEETNG